MDLVLRTETLAVTKVNYAQAAEEIHAAFRVTCMQSCILKVKLQIRTKDTCIAMECVA